MSNPSSRSALKTVDNIAVAIASNWLNVFLVGYGIWVLLPFTTPFLMQIGWTLPANLLYALYSLFCHQLPERSLFFFGDKLMYSFQEIAQYWPTNNPIILRQFVGNEELGWKMAWSDRMISVYGGVWLAGLLWAALGPKRAPRLSLFWWIVIGVAPLGIDGVSHMLNDIVAGTSGLGFRDTNTWLVALTGNVLPADFYQGDALGSFNSWARWLSGFLFAFASVFALFPIIGGSMDDTARDAERQLSRIAAREQQNKPQA
ncbi:MAG: DUF2085 domain-containing protein [Chloroflexi bacterium]|nr:DUF2085 domain-containing protein [Chloroflexota bacterium]